MSEPMTSGEIEDVLSSIRKLVSEDLRPQPRPATPPPAPESDKLILTPALRVVEGNAEAEATRATGEPPEQAAPRRLRLDAVVSSFAAQVTPPAEGWEAETGDATVTRLVRTPASGPAPVEAFPDAAAEDDTGVRQGMPDAGQAEPAPAARLHFGWQAGQSGSGDDPVADGPPEAGDDVLAGDEPSDAAPVDLDAEALADLVRDILREELQGALGERMTRNIRKLVRAEVARVLATRDLA